MTKAAAAERQKAKAMASIFTTFTTTPLRLHSTEATISNATPAAREPFGTARSGARLCWSTGGCDTAA